MNVNETKYWTDASANNYWGNNILWNPGSNLSFKGWIMIKDPNGNVMDAFVANWDAAAIANSTIGLGTVWTGPGWDQTTVPSGNSASRIAPGNDASAYANQANSLGSTNPGLLLPFVSGGAYSYLWDTGDTTEDVSALTSGTYCVTITDCNGCSVSVCDTVGIWCYLWMYRFYSCKL